MKYLHATATDDLLEAMCATTQMVMSKLVQICLVSKLT